MNSVSEFHLQIELKNKSQRRTEGLNEGFHHNPSYQQSQYRDSSDNQLNAKQHTQKCFINQIITNGQQRTELEQMDPHAPSFGPYNGAWA